VASSLSVFFSELRRRKVARVAVVYTLVGLGVIEGASMILPTLQLEAAYDYIVILVILGAPIALVLAWALEVTPGGIQRTPALTPEELAARTPAGWSSSSWVMTGLGFGVVLAAGYFVLFRDEPESLLPENYVAVFPLENLTGDPELDDLGWYAADWITAGLVGVPEIRQVAANKVEEVLSLVGDSITRLEVAENLGVGIAVTGLIILSGDSLELRAEITRVTDGNLIQSVEELGSADDPRQVVASFRDRVMGALAVISDEYSVPQGSNPPTYEAFQSYRRGWERWLAGDPSGAIPHLEDSFRQDSSWTPSAISLFVAYQAAQSNEERDSLRTWLDSRRLDMDPAERARWDGVVALVEGNLEVQYEAARFQYRLDPTGNAVNLANLATLVGRPREALQAMELVDLTAPIWRDFPYQWAFSPWAHHMLGSYEEELEAARQGIERFPDFLELRLLELRALAGMGRLSEMSPLLDQLGRMEPDGYNRSPGSVFRRVAWELARFGYDEESQAVAERSLSWYLARDPARYQRSRAEVLLFLGRIDEALTLLVPLVEGSPDNVQYVGLHGVALALTGDSAGAVAAERRIEALQSPYLSGSDTRWRAAIAAHLGREDEAVRLLGQALREGQQYIHLSADPYFKELWGYEPFEQLISPKG